MGTLGERIDALLAEFEGLGIDRQVGYDRLHLYSIVTHSTAIEGSTLTLEENTVMFDDGIVPAGKPLIEQLMNLDLKKAYDVAHEVAEGRTPVTSALLRAMSAVVMRNTGALYHTPNGAYDEARGDLRLQNVSAGRGGCSYLSWEKVPERFAEYCQWLQGRLENVGELGKVGVYELSFEAHYRLVTIHPWSDGNGRMARLVMNLVQVEGGVVPTYVRSQRKAEYLATLRSSQELGDSIAFRTFMLEETASILDEEVSAYKASMDADVPWRSDCRQRCR